ncbi:uncharacterized protein LOC141587833 [Silene latifolia]|uniref:uncharacterized protein LOC141587833 n=1 Tax=Silene latifolia TaxID=37657 RepID=UPI003D7717CE
MREGVLVSGVEDMVLGGLGRLFWWRLGRFLAAELAARGVVDRVDHTDVAGLLSIVEDKKAVMTKNGPTTLRNIQIQDERECTAKITFWGDTSNIIDERIGGQAQDKVIVVTSLRVVTFEGSYQLQSTFGTKLCIDLNIPEANNILERRQEPVQVEFINNNARQGEEETTVTNRKTISQLLEMDITNEKEMFICHGTISAIRTDIDWWYLPCTNCITGIDDEGKCRQCKETISYPMQRYRLMTTLTDGIAYAALILFCKEAEKVIGKPIEKMVAMIGKEYTFKVKVGITRYGKQRELKGQKIIEPEHAEQNEESKQEGTTQTKLK